MVLRGHHVDRGSELLGRRAATGTEGEVTISPDGDELRFLADRRVRRVSLVGRGDRVRGVHRHSERV